jgi:hypothetical protein
MPFFEFAGFGLGGGVPFGVSFRRFGTRLSYPHWLEAYKEELEEELKAVNEEIEELRRETARA